MSQSNSSALANYAPKRLTPSQQQWLDGIIASMKNTINTDFEPVHDHRTPLEKALADDHHLANIDIYYDGARHEALAMHFADGQFPDFYSLWVARRAELGRGLSICHTTARAYLSDLWFQCRPPCQEGRERRILHPPHCIEAIISPGVLGTRVPLQMLHSC